MMLADYSKRAFLEADEQERLLLCSRLQEEVEKRLDCGTEFHRSVGRLVAWLRSLGHDLWSMDEDDDFETWGPDYTKSESRGLMVTFSTEDGVLVEWSKQ